MAGTQIYAAMHLREDGKDDLRVNIQREDWKKAGPIMTVRNPEGQQLMFAIADGGQLQFSIRRESQATEHLRQQPHLHFTPDHQPR